MKRLAGLVALVLLAGAYAKTSSTPEAKQSAPIKQEVKQEEPPPPPPTPAIGERVSDKFWRYAKDKAHFDCQEAIKRQAEYGIRAPGVVYGTNYNRDVFLRFTHGRFTVDDKWTISMAGDDAEAQNAGGTWVGVKYACIFDVRDFAVKDAFILRGRFTD